MSDYSLADIAAVKGDGDGMFAGNGSGMWIFALLILLLIGGNGGGLFGGGNAVQQSDLQRAVDLNSIQEGQATINTNIQRIGYETMSTVKDAAYNNLSEIRDVQAGVSAGFANLQNCCCETLRAIDGVNYNGAMNTASINANTTAQVQKILDAINGNRMADMQNQINQLQLSSAMCGLPRISPYGYTMVPAFGSSCGCNGYNI